MHVDVRRADANLRRRHDRLEGNGVVIVVARGNVAVREPEVRAAGASACEKTSATVSGVNTRRERALRP